MKRCEAKVSRRARNWLMVLVLGVVPAGLMAAPSGGGEDAAEPTSAALADLKLEDLMSIGVTSVARRTQALNDSAAPIHVITAEDIRRSGATTLTDALMLAPGVNVAHISGENHSVSMRGFAGQFANKLLVMIDGRSIYTQMFSGVYWDMHNIPMEDIERIEVVRGPGSTLWGANAVNGVINIITKSARDTEGALFSIQGGTRDRGSMTARYGFKLGDQGAARLYVRHDGRGETQKFDGTPANDDYRLTRMGGRADFDLRGGDRLTFSGEVFDGKPGVGYDPSPTSPFSQLTRPDGYMRGSAVLARWQRALSLSSDVSVQFWYSGFERKEFAVAKEEVTDFEVQHQTQTHAANNLVWGLNVRNRRDRIWDDQNPNSSVLTVPALFQHQASLFAQDTWSVIPEQLQLILGARLEHSYWGKNHFQPNLRAMWSPDQQTRVWGSIARSARTASRVDRNLDVKMPFPQLAGLNVRGSDQFDAENVVTSEIGVRHALKRDLLVDVTLYSSRYDHVVSYHDNLSFTPYPYLTQTVSGSIQGTIRGIESSVIWNPSRHWRIQAQATLAQCDLEDPTVAVQREALVICGTTPKKTAAILVQHDLGQQWTVDAQLRHVGALTKTIATIQSQTTSIPEYVDLNLRLGWRVSPRLDVSLIGAQLLHANRVEYVSETGQGVTQLPRTVMLRASVRY